MRALRFAVIAALISVSALECSDAFARSSGGAAGGSAGAAGGTSGGGGAGSTAASELSVEPIRQPPPRFIRAPLARYEASCFKQDHLYDRYGDPVVNLHGLDCFGG